MSRSKAIVCIKVFLWIILVPTVLLELLAVLFRLTYLTDIATGLFVAPYETTVLHAWAGAFMAIATPPQAVLILQTLRSAANVPQQRPISRAVKLAAISLVPMLIGAGLETWVAYRESSLPMVLDDEFLGFFAPLLCSVVVAGACLLLIHFKSPQAP